MPLTHGYTEDAVLAMSDDELVEHVHRWVDDIKDDNVSDALFWLITETFERFAPEAAWRNVERWYAEESDPLEIETARRAVRRRQGAADDPRPLPRLRLTPV